MKTRLRSRAEPEGMRLPDGSLPAEVTEANDLAAVAVELAVLVWSIEGLPIVDNPAGSYFWELPAVKAHLA